MKKKFMYICLTTGLFSSGILVNNLNANAENYHNNKNKLLRSLKDKISNAVVSFKQSIKRKYANEGKKNTISERKDASIKNANAAIKAYAWGDAEKKAIAEKCIQEISKCHKIIGDKEEMVDYEKEYIYSTFNTIDDRRKAERILQNIIKAYQSDKYNNVRYSMQIDIFGMIFDAEEYNNKKYCKHDRLEILEFMTEKSVPAAIEIATSEDCKDNKMTDVKRDGVIPYILGSANDNELNFRKQVAQEYIKLIVSENNGKSIKNSVEIEIRERLFESANDKELDFRKKVAQEYIKLVTSAHNGKSIKDRIAIEISEKLFESANEQDLNQKVQEIKERYNLN